MRKFIKQLSIFLLLTILLSIVITTLSKLSLDKNTTYFWGDSQTLQGVDLDVFAKIRKVNVKSTAARGAGVYDFLVFADNVPNCTNCVVGFSQYSLLKEKTQDNNRSGINVKMLIELCKQNYSVKEVIKIINENKLVPINNLFNRSHERNEYCDTIINSKYLNGFIEFYDKEPPFFVDKVELYKKGLDILMNKHCNVTIVEFPYHSKLYEVSSASPYKNVIDSVRQNICDKYSNGRFDTIYIDDSDSLLMYDLTHMNEVGSRRFTEALCNYFDTCDARQNHFIIVNGGKCN